MRSSRITRAPTNFFLNPVAELQLKTFLLGGFSLSLAKINHPIALTPRRTYPLSLSLPPLNSVFPLEKIPSTRAARMTNGPLSLSLAAKTEQMTWKWNVAFISRGSFVFFFSLSYARSRGNGLADFADPFAGRDFLASSGFSLAERSGFSCFLRAWGIVVCFFPFSEDEWTRGFACVLLAISMEEVERVRIAREAVDRVVSCDMILRFRVQVVMFGLGLFFFFFL